jgi:hypothetical protein
MWLDGPARFPGFAEKLDCQFIPIPKFLPILVEKRDMPDRMADSGQEKGSLARVNQ